MMTRIIAAMAFILVAGTVYAITRVEERIEDIRICIGNNDSGPTLMMQFRTYDQDGLVRDVRDRDVWSTLSPTQQGQVKGIIDAVKSSLYTKEVVAVPILKEFTPVDQIDPIEVGP